MPIKNLNLTTAEELALKEWVKYEAQWGAPPTQRHLADALGCYINSVQHLLKSLRAKGYLRDQKVTRTRLALSRKAKKKVL